MYNKLRKDWAKAQQLLASRPEPYIPTQRGVRLSKATRKLLRKAYKHHRALMRERKTRDRLEWYLKRKALRAEIAKILEEKKVPQTRVRTMSFPVQVLAPRPTFKVNNVVTLAPVGYFSSYYKQAMVDVKPTFRSAIGKRLNPMTANKSWSNSTSCGIGWSGPKVYGSFPKGKWALNARYLHPVVTDLVNPLTFSFSAADRALQKAYAEIKKPDLALNEYVFEHRQVLRLLVDPLRTLRNFQRLYQRWLSQDAWMYQAPVRVRRFGGGTLTSIAPPGATLMSFRTKKEIRASEVSASVLQAAANRWLQWRYGIMPLWLDLCAIMGGLVEKPPSLTWYVGEAKHWLSKSKTSDQLSIKWGFCNHVYNSTVKKGEFYSAGVYYRLKRNIPNSYRMGLHPSQLMRALWNGLHFSFVADWVVNVDDWLLAGTSMPGLEIGPNYVSAKSYENVTSTLVKVYVPGFESEQASISSPGIYRFGYERINRHVNLPWKNELAFSMAWQRVKNLLTAEALLVSEIFKKQKKK